MWIYNVESNEELDLVLAMSPVYNYAKYDVLPLAEMTDLATLLVKMVKRPGQPEASMRRVMLTLCLLSVVAHAQENPLAWFPLRVGSRWVYEQEWKSGDRNGPDVDRWTTEVSIKGVVTIPEGMVVLRQVTVQSGSTGRTTKVRGPNGQVREAELPRIPHAGYIVSRDHEPYLVRNNCVYVIGERWDEQNQRLRPSYQEYLAKNALSADFCFPLEMCVQWGNRDVAWSVEPARGAMASFLPSKYAGAIHIFSSHFGSGGSEDVWFQKGIGVVAEHYLHNGTYDEYSTKLLSFTR